MAQKVIFLFFIEIIISVLYLNQGCNVITPAPTPTPIPTATPMPTSTPTTEPTEDPTSYLIVPGKGVAGLQINKSILDDVKKLLGESTSRPTTEQGYIKINYETQKLTFWFDSKKNILKCILIENASYKTAEGIGVGSSSFDISKSYPKGAQDKDKKVYYADDGTDYYYDVGTITSIFISKRAAVVPTPTRPPTPTPFPPPPPEYTSSAKEAIDALQALHSVVKVGISYKDYPGKLADCKIKIDKFLRDNPTEYVPGLNTKIEQAMSAYEDSLTWWDMKFASGHVANFVDNSNPTVVYCFQVYPNMGADMSTHRDESGTMYFIDDGLPLLWGYASKYIDEASNLLNARK